MFNFFKKKLPPNDVFKVLHELGFSFTAESARKTLIEELEKVEDSKFEIALCMMGDEQYEEDGGEVLPWVSDDVWHFDYEAIDGNGSYISIVKSCSRLAQGDLPVTQLRDQIVSEGQVANVTFVLEGKTFVHNLRFNNDWADPLLFALLNSALTGAGSNKRFFEHDLGQDCLLICKSPSDVEKINKVTGLHFLESKG
jgi:hypothetical protein